MVGSLTDCVPYPDWARLVVGSLNLPLDCPETVCLASVPGPYSYAEKSDRRWAIFWSVFHPFPRQNVGLETTRLFAMTRSSRVPFFRVETGLIPCCFADILSWSVDDVYDWFLSQGQSLPMRAPSLARVKSNSWSKTPYVMSLRRQHTVFLTVNLILTRTSGAAPRRHVDLPTNLLVGTWGDVAIKTVVGDGSDIFCVGFYSHT